MGNVSQQLEKLSGRAFGIPINSTYLEANQDPRDDEKTPLVAVVLTLHLLDAALEKEMIGRLLEIGIAAGRYHLVEMHIVLGACLAAALVVLLQCVHVVGLPGDLDGLLPAGHLHGMQKEKGRCDLSYGQQQQKHSTLS